MIEVFFGRQHNRRQDYWQLTIGGGFERNERSTDRLVRDSRDVNGFWREIENTKQLGTLEWRIELAFHSFSLETFPFK